MSSHVTPGAAPSHGNQPASPSPETMPKQTFDGLGIKQNIIDILAKIKFTHPTPIQAKTIPMAVTGQDVLGIAQTGTGKTLAFGIPMAQKLSLVNGMGLVLVPTRELALQVYETLSRITTPLNIPATLVIGGESMHRQIQNLRRNPRIIIATPGRLNDHLRQRTVKLDRVNVLVLDEADRMLDMGFAPQIKEIIKHVSPERQTLLFSATMPAELTKLAHSFMKEPLRIEIAPQGSTIALVTQEIFFVPKQLKPALLMNLLNQYKGTVLVFSRTKFGAKRIAEALRTKNISSAEIHSNRSQAQRKAALEGFKRGTFRVLVATDIAARGIHVSDIELVINYDLPEQTSDYVHRIGRTGRAGKTGHAISFASPDQKNDVRDIERLIKKILKVTPLPALPTDVYLPATRYEEPSRGGRPQGRGQFGNRGSRPFGNSQYGSRDSKPRHDSYSKPSYGSARPSFGQASTEKSGQYESRPATGGYSKPFKKFGDRPSGTYSKSKPSFDSTRTSSGFSKPRRPFGKKAGEFIKRNGQSSGSQFPSRRPSRNKYPKGFSRQQG